MTLIISRHNSSSACLRVNILCTTLRTVSIIVARRVQCHPQTSWKRNNSHTPNRNLKLCFLGSAGTKIFYHTRYLPRENQGFGVTWNEGNKERKNVTEKEVPVPASCWLQTCAVTSDFWCEVELLFEFAVNWTGKQFYLCTLFPVTIRCGDRKSHTY